MPRRRHSSPQAALVFAALAEDAAGWQHGYDLSRRTGLASGTLYPLLMRLHEAGYLDARWEEAAAPSRPPRHAYRLTATGAAFGRDLLAKRDLLAERAPVAGTAEGCA
ncbi:PadR family transcriptional regulator [Methylobacterium oryzisoli]|uniref:PadR family transcriptional regulator n=1 Tax=Methylobacterium oryzisoli TaxID=3385502 RepID=UPI003891DA11